jgi:sodium/pantothenate symporter
MNIQVLLPLVIYLAVMFSLAFYSRRRLSGSGSFLEEYFIGSRSMGGFVLAMTMVATYTSASSFVGGPGVAYKMGLGWVLLAMIQLPTAWLTLGVLGKKFAIIARRVNAVTVNDILRERYQSRWVVILGSLSLVLFFIAAMVAQFIGGARLLEGMTGLSYNMGLMIFASTVILYTCIGGFRAVVLTDTVQGVVMMIGTVALLIGILHAGGGMETTVTTLREIDPALVTPFGPNEFLAKRFIISFWILVCFGVIGLPHSAVRCFGYRDSRSMHTAIVLSTVVVGVIMLGMHLSGALGRAILPEIAVGDKIIPAISLAVLHPVVAGIFIAGPLAAIMSTIDSQLILASAAIVKDLYLNYICPTESEEEAEKLVKKLGSWTTLLIGIIVFLAAFRPPDLIVWLNLFAFGGMQAAFLWPMVLGLYWKRANAMGALVSMVSGLVTYFYMVSFVKRFYGMHVIVPTLVVSLLVFVVVSLATRGPDTNILKLFWGRDKVSDK